MSTNVQDAAEGKPSEREIQKVAGVSLIGASIEWYDNNLYGAAAAVIFPMVFFAGDLPPLVAAFAAFATLGIAFLVRPIGAIVFGHYGDRYGRKATLVISMVLMGVASTLIGVLPSYATAGMWAPLLLILLRCAQGFSLGGQWGGSMLLVTESAPKHRRGFYGAFAQAGGSVGVLLATFALWVVSANLSDEAFVSWGWRIPFLVSIALIAVALYVQFRLEETETFKRLQQLGETRERTGRGDGAVKRSPVLSALTRYPKEILLAAGAFIAIQVGFYIFMVFVYVYANTPGLSIPRPTILFAVMAGGALMLVSVFLSAAFSDRYGRRGIYMAGAALLGVWGFIAFPLIDTGSLLWILIAVGVAQVAIGMMYGPQAALFAELFSTEVRYSGASLGYQLGAILGGAAAPMVATALLAQFGSSVPISIYLAVACVISLLSIAALKETYQRDLDE